MATKSRAYSAEDIEILEDLSPILHRPGMYTDPVNPNHALVEVIDNGMYVIETMGMHTANPVSGDFSVGASGLWIEKGSFSHPVKEAVISGNILHLFRNIRLVGDDLKFYGSIGSPTILIEEIDIRG